MQRSPHSKQPKTTKFDVFMLSDSDVAFLNNEAPKMFDEEASFEIDRTLPSHNRFHANDFSGPQQPQPGTPPQSYRNEETSYSSEPTQVFIPTDNSVSTTADDHSSTLTNEPLFLNDSNDLVFSSVSETRLYQPRPQYDSDDLDDVLNKIVVSEPLLTEDDILFLVKKEYTGEYNLTRKLLKRLLKRNQLENGYQRLKAYTTGISYE